MFAGLDIGSISSKLVLVDKDGKIIFSKYQPNHGNPVKAVYSIIEEAETRNSDRYVSLCTTGSGRKFIGRLIQADIIKNEITSLWMAATSILPDVRTIMEIGGQDSKLITIDKGEITDFRLNSVCAAGTGSFIEQQSNRLGIPIKDLSDLAGQTDKRARFTGRCTVFVETEMINLQQSGYPMESIAAGLIDAICENFLNDLAAGMEIQEPVIFCGGVSCIESVRISFEKKLGLRIIVPDVNRVAAAYGAALLAVRSRNMIDFSDLKWRTLRMDNIEDIIASSCKQSDCLNCGVCGGKME